MKDPTEGTPISDSAAFTRVEVFGVGDEYFAALQQAIATAQNTIDIEMYIFALDVVGEPLLDSLARAVLRGLRVRLVVDGIGSSSWTRALRARARRAGILCKVFHELPWERWLGTNDVIERPKRWRQLLRRLNSRNHRKVFIIDSEKAFLGSMNISKWHLASVVGGAAWRDTGVVIEGEGVHRLADSFEDLWGGRIRRIKQRFKWIPRHRKGDIHRQNIRLNARRRDREENYVDLLFRIVNSRDKVWITNAYFVPDGSLLRALGVAAMSGVDVRIVVPGFSDVVFMPWIASAFHLGLLKAGVRIFEYRKSILHAKTMVIDSWGLVGSSNLNHRSLLHDLEVDVVVSDHTNREILERQFLEDISQSVEVTLKTWRQRPWIERALGQLLLAFRRLL